MKLFDLISVIFVPLSRTNAAKTKGVGLYAILLALLKICGIVALVALTSGLTFNAIPSISSSFEELVGNNKYAISILAYLAMFIPLIAFAVLLRNLKVKENPGLVILGFAIALLAYATTKSIRFTLAISALGAIGIASLVYTNVSVSTEVKSERKGVGEKWW